MAKIKIKKFDDKADQFKWMADNQVTLKAQRRAEPKKSDAISFMSFAIDEKGERLAVKAKADTTQEEVINEDVLKIRCIINTTNFFDSHSDVHQVGIWKKSLKETAMLLLCYEHEMTYKGILSDEVTAYTKNYTWKELGFPYDGETEALVFDCVLTKDNITDDKKFMFDRYKNGKVYNHSVRMQYIKEYWCLNSEEAYATQYKENWDKYITSVANQDDAIANGWFYAVTEAKIIEGSAVVRGSNSATPAIEYTEGKELAEKSLEENNPEPTVVTQTQKKKVFIN